MVYKKILDMVGKNDFESASKAYFDTAIKQTVKRDYDTASVLILLGSLCLLKKGNQISTIQGYLNEFMGKVGFSEKVISGTFSVKILKLLMDAKTIGNSAMYTSAWNLLQHIPVFEEEKRLFEN
jgi:hypothetical protein